MLVTLLSLQFPPAKWECQNAPQNGMIHVGELPGGALPMEMRQLIIKRADIQITLPKYNTSGGGKGKGTSRVWVEF